MNDVAVAVRSLMAEPYRRYVFNESLFRERTGALGACTDLARCRVAGLSRATLARWRRGTVAPSLPVLDRVAERLQVERHRLLREVRPCRPS